MGGRHSKSYRVVAEEGSISDVGIIRRTGSGPDLTTQQQQQQQQPSQSSEEDSTMISTVLCQVDDLKDGQMKDFTVEGKKVLLVKDEGQFHAVGAKCTHYGANLATGAYSNGRVRCPWHGACFSVTTGDIEDFPGLDSLPKFQTKIEGNSVVLLATKEELEVVKRTKPMCSMADDCHEAPVIIVGGGAAALTCAESLRQHSYQGNIIMMTQESSAPYDRIKLSKAPDTPVDKILLRTADFYEKHKIQIMTNSQVTSVSVVDKAVTLADQDTVHYSKLVIATGGTPRMLTCPGADLQGIHYLRTPEDGLSISESVQGRDVVIIGSSFIGMELAAFLPGRARSVTVVGSTSAPLVHFGPEIGSAMRKLFESKGVQFKLQAKLVSLIGENGRVTHAVLGDGSQLVAETILVGIGVVPATAFLKDSGIEMNPQGFIKVDATMKTNVDDVYAAGDIVTFPMAALELENVNIQHWQMAHKHGNVAGAAIAGIAKPIDTVPFFWTMVFGKSIRYTGHGGGHDDVVIHGIVDDLQFVAYYLKKGKVIAVASLGRDPVCAVFAQIFLARKPVTKADIESNPNDDWTSWLSA